MAAIRENIIREPGAAYIGLDADGAKSIPQWRKYDVLVSMSGIQATLLTKTRLSKLKTDFALTQERGKTRGRRC